MDDKLIWYKENSIDTSFCEHVINKFENDSRKSAGCIGSNKPVIDKTIKDTHDLPISNLPDWKEEDEIFYKALQEGLKEYMNYLTEKHYRCVPNTNYKTSDTGYKIQRYEPEGFYDWHNDWVLDIDYGSRIFVFMWYLNTLRIEDDGYTEFLGGKTIYPKCGRLMFFPATWTYVHRGYRPRVRKYLCNGWIYAKIPD
tara:strand:- start:100 stop:690 length:591 start_codon:yes stop_codon:yes gene_type:complete